MTSPVQHLGKEGKEALVSQQQQQQQQRLLEVNGPLGELVGAAVLCATVSTAVFAAAWLTPYGRIWSPHSGMARRDAQRDAHITLQSAI